jgi:hypothetical protein
MAAKRPLAKFIKRMIRKSGDGPSEGAVARRRQEAGPDARGKQVAGT